MDDSREILAIRVLWPLVSLYENIESRTRGGQRLTWRRKYVAEIFGEEGDKNKEVWGKLPVSFKGK